MSPVVTPVDRIDVYAAATRLAVGPATLRQWATRDRWTQHGRDDQGRALWSWREIAASATRRTARQG